MGITLFKRFKKENLDINRIDLDRKSIYSGIVVKLSQKLVTETGLYDKEELEEEIKSFLIIMLENFPTFPLERFKETFATLNINNRTLENNTSFYYNDLNSKSINLLSKDDLFHEFLHFASDKNCEGKLMVGFEYSDEKIKRLGIGLNEGYTQLLANRCFPSSEHLFRELYTMEVVKRLEDVIGREKMGDLYFNGNLFDIINELTELSSEEEAKQFILDLDNLCKIYHKNGTFGQNIEFMNELLNKLCQYIDKCVLAKNNNKESVM